MKLSIRDEMFTLLVLEPIVVVAALPVGIFSFDFFPLLSFSSKTRQSSISISRTENQIFPFMSISIKILTNLWSRFLNILFQNTIIPDVGQSKERVFYAQWQE